MPQNLSNVVESSCFYCWNCNLSPR